MNDRMYVAAKFVDRDAEGRNTLTNFLEAGMLTEWAVLNWAA